MLFQPFITFVVLTINLSSTYAMKEQNEQNQQATVPIAAAMNHPSDNMYPSTDQKAHRFFQFGRKNKPVASQNINPHNNLPTVPIAAAMNYPQSNTHPPAYPSPHHGQSPNHQPIGKINPPHEDPSFTEAQCGYTRYYKYDIIAARKEGCDSMPFYPDLIKTRKADRYYPANPAKYNGKPPFYLYPIGKPKHGITRTRHYGMDRIVLNEWCQAVDVITQMPRATEFFTKFGNYIMRRPTEFNQKNYQYKPCNLS